MKIGKILAVAAVATVFASCSNEEELANVGKSESNAIRFAGISGLSDTRTTPIGTTNLTTTDFDVMAFMSSDNALFMGGKHVSGVSDHGVKIVYKTSAWDYADPDQMAYWPTEGDVDFYAVSPAISNDLVLDNGFAYDMTSVAKTISYRMVDEYNTTGTNHDVMYAVAKGRNKVNNGTNAVQMNFKHILSQVVFKAKTASSILEVDVENVKIHNLVHSGTFTLPEGEPAMSNWSLSPVAEGAYAVKLAANVKTNNAVVELSDMNSPLMMIPQKLTKWSTSTGAAVSKYVADTKKECYLEISMKLKQNDSYLIGSAAEYKTVYVPFDNATGWEPGKRYIYTLIFGGGYDDQGEPILSPITFNAATTDWVDATGADVNL